MAHVTIENTPSYVKYDVTSSDDGPFLVPFAIFEKADLTIEVDGESIGAAFSFTPTSSTTGGYQTGTVTLDVAVANAEVLIYRNILATRTSDYGPGPLSRDAINSAFDRVQAQIQDLGRDMAHALRAALGNPMDPVAPEVGKVLGWSAQLKLTNLTPANVGADLVLGDGVAEVLTLDEKVFYPRAYGAVGNGTAFDDTAFWACVADAQAAGGWVDGENLVYRLSALKILNGPAVFKWRNLTLYKSDKTAIDYEYLLTIRGEPFGSVVPVTANVALQASSVSVSSATGIAAGQKYLLISNAQYNPDPQGYGNTIASKSDWVRVRPTYAGGLTVTLSAPVRSSFLLADSVRMYRFYETTEIWWQNVTLQGGGLGKAQGGVRMDRCVIHQFNDVRSIDNEYAGITNNLCGFRQGVRVSGRGANLQSYGYLLECSGCDAPLIDRVDGEDCRHTATFGSSFQAQLPNSGGNHYILGRGGAGGRVSGPNSVGSVIDTHVGHQVFKLDSATGSLVEFNAQEAVTIEASGWHIGVVQITGSEQGVVVLNYGRPTDEPSAAATFGMIDLGRGGTGTNPALIVENRDAQYGDGFFVTFEVLRADWPGHITASAAWGEVHVMGSCTIGQARTTHNFNAVSSANARSFIDVDKPFISNTANNASIYVAIANGAAREDVDTKKYGSSIKLGAGSISTAQTAFRADDGLITISPLLQVSAGTPKSETGIGQVQVATTNLNAVAPPAPGFAGDHVVGTDAVNVARVTDSFGATPFLITRRAGGTNSSKSAVQSGNSLGQWSGQGYGATGYGGSRVSITYAANENWTDSAQGTRMDFQTTLLGASTQGVRMTLYAGLTMTGASDQGAGTVSATVMHATTSYNVAGTKVIGAQGAAVTSATGGSTIDTEARAAINTLLTRLRTHGLIAP